MAIKFNEKSGKYEVRQNGGVREFGQMDEAQAYEKELMLKRQAVNPNRGRKNKGWGSR